MANESGGGPGDGRSLDPDAVLREALDLLDEVGVDALTMRGLADRLGTYPNVVYWHVGNRERLLALTVDLALREIAVPDSAGLTWQQWLEATARELRRVVHRHPSIAPILASRVLISPPTLLLVEEVLAVLATAGFSGADLAAAYNTYVGSVVGWVCMEVAAPAVGGEEWQSAFRDTVENLDPVQFPTIGAHKDHLADQVFALRWHGGRERPLQDSFDLALQVWLCGLERSPRRSGIVGNSP